MEAFGDEFKNLYNEKNKFSWEFSQMFGEDDSDSDLSESGGSEESTDNWISTLSFDASGKYLAVGYYCGQVVILKQQQNEKTYQLLTEFKSHESEFDFLTSMEIEEKISHIKWFPFSQSRSKRLLTCNDKTIKLFKLNEKLNGSKRSVVRTERVYEGGHSYNINGMSFSSDGETFISSDDLRINLWHVEVKNEVFNVVDTKPENMDDLQEIITSSDLNPKQCKDLIYSTSKGVIRMVDLRDSATCDSYHKAFEDSVPEVTGYFQELVSSISHVKFSPCGRFFSSRDYLTIKIWDVRNEKNPLNIIRCNQNLRTKLYDLYENDSIYDKFECAWSSNSSHILTGSYNNTFYTCEALGNKIDPVKATKPGDSKVFNENENIESSQKILKLAWNPKMNSIVLGAKDFGYIYQKKGKDMIK